jgi:hypothetical protein
MKDRVLVNFGQHSCQVKTDIFEVYTYLYILIEKTMFECHVNLFAYIIIIMTIITHHYKVELFENNVELKQKKYT